MLKLLIKNPQKDIVHRIEELNRNKKPKYLIEPIQRPNSISVGDIVAIGMFVTAGILVLGVIGFMLCLPLLFIFLAIFTLIIFLYIKTRIDMKKNRVALQRKVENSKKYFIDLLVHDLKMTVIEER